MLDLMIVGIGGTAERVFTNKFASESDHVKVGALANERTGVGLALLTEHASVEDVTEAVVTDRAGGQATAVERNAADQVLDDGLAVARDAWLLDGIRGDRHGQDGHGHGGRVGWCGHWHDSWSWDNRGWRRSRVQRKLNERLWLAVDWLGRMLLNRRWSWSGLRI